MGLNALRCILSRRLSQNQGIWSRLFGKSGCQRLGEVTIYHPALPGIAGSPQAAEAIKLIPSNGEPLVGRLLMFDALDMDFGVLNVRRNPECPLCGEIRRSRR